MSEFAAPIADGTFWWIAAIGAGVIPLYIGWGLGTSYHQGVSAVLLFFLLLSNARHDSWARGIATLAIGFGAHCATAIGLTYFDPVGAALIMPDGAAYYEAQIQWITTGQDPEYEWSNWLPHHVQLLAGISFLSFTSMGFLALVQGFYEVDLMNYYVGSLLSNSDHSAIVLGLGWHPWSVLRGFCYVVLAYEVSSLTLGLFSGRKISSMRVRRFRWMAVLGFFFSDILMKILALDFVRRALAANLLE